MRNFDIFLISVGFLHSQHVKPDLRCTQPPGGSLRWTASCCHKDTQLCIVINFKLLLKDCTCSKHSFGILALEYFLFLLLYFVHYRTILNFYSSIVLILVTCYFEYYLLQEKVANIAILADIQQMFHCFPVREDHKNYLKFVYGCLLCSPHGKGCFFM